MSELGRWRGGVRIRPGVLAFTGEIGAARAHAHAAVQVYWCERGQVEVVDGTGATVASAKVVIPTRARHAVRAVPGTVGVSMFLDPSGRWAPEGGSWELSVEGWADEERGAFADRVVDLDVLGRGPGSLGSRIEQCVRERLPDRVSVSDVARALSVSESTLRRVASAELGLSVRSYMRWVRLIVALESVGSGRGITDAAHEAGFADGSHATRVCWEMFGLSPSEAISHLTIAET